MATPYRSARIARTGAAALVLAMVAACSGGAQRSADEIIERERISRGDLIAGERRSSFLDLFRNEADPNTTLEVNRYLWAASLDVLSFMPVANADPFSGIIQFGYGTPPGGGRAYQATVYVQDPALDARSLNVALRTRGGAVDRQTSRAIEDAILTRARQLRIQDSRL
ncbi:DUF3576 domain-containing protein [Jannaschia sp. LMIT008]|uniref:DUF3576 domain-containing protein n=1 Tax=Jannaschia maritima TaxID=3032585 RepID=UPI0028117137|nr:DUF3576 domain-containing protein [Jannaschia sp. LMIT008]